MKLSKELFNDIRDALLDHQHDADDGAATESRRAIRVRVDLEIGLLPHGSLCGRSRPVKLRNFSASGICILDWQVMRPDEQFVIHLPRKSGGVVPIVCTVRNSRVRGNGLFFTGAEFTSHAESDVGRTPFAQSVEGLASRVVLVPTSQQMNQTPGDKRSDPRSNVRGRAAMTVEQPDGQPSLPIEVEICDVSNGGICILFTREMKAGQRFQIQVSSPTHEELWLQYAVRSCRPIRNRKRYRIGGQLESIQSHRRTGSLMSRLRRLFGSDTTAAEAARRELEAHLQRHNYAAANPE